MLTQPQVVLWVSTCQLKPPRLTAAEDARLYNTVRDQEEPVKSEAAAHLYSSLTQKSAVAVPLLAETSAPRHA